MRIASRYRENLPALVESASSSVQERRPKAVIWTDAEMMLLAYRQSSLRQRS
ncbi:MAG: hypothetical protein ABIX10_09300 [Acidimicrobiales bacterium]